MSSLYSAPPRAVNAAALDPADTPDILSVAAEMGAWVCVACVLTLINRFWGYVLPTPAFGTVLGHTLALLYLAGLLFALLQTARAAARLPVTTGLLLVAGLLLAVPMGVVLLVQNQHIVIPPYLSLTANNLFLVLAAALVGAGIGRIIKHPNTLLAGAGFACFFDIVVVTMGTVAQLMKTNSAIISAVSVGGGANIGQQAGIPGPRLPDPLSSVTIGPADVLFLALFLSAVYQMNLSKRATFAWMFTLLALALLIVELFGLPIPALAPMGIAVLIANARHGAFTPTERRDLTIGAVFAVFCAGCIIAGSRAFIKPAPAPVRFGMALGPIGPQSSLYVGKIEPGSAAEKGGMRAGDEVVTINGIETRRITEEQYQTALEDGKKNGLHLTLRRKGETQTRDVILRIGK